MAAAYKSNDEHLADELRWLDRLLALRTAELRARREAAPVPRTQYVSHEEVDWLLAGATASAPADTEHLRRALEACATDVQSRVERSTGVPLALVELTDRFALSPFEQRAVVVCLAPELDRKYDKLYAYLQDDVTRKRPSVDLVLDLLGDDPEQRRAKRTRLTRQAPLVQRAILQEIPDPGSPSGASDLARFLALDPRILGFLTGSADLDARLTDLVTLDDPADGSVGFVDPAIEERVLHLVERAAEPLVLFLHGPDGGSKRQLALSACAHTGHRLLRLDVAALLRRADVEPLFRLALREAVLSQTLIYLDDADDGHAQLAGMLAEHTELAFVAGARAPQRPPSLGDKRFLDVELPLPGPAVREQAWQASLAPHATPPEWSADLGSRFKLTPDQIRAAVGSAALEALAQPEPADLELSDLTRAARRHSQHRLGDLAVHVEAHATWPDLVLPAERIEQLREICSQVRFQHDVLDDWGFARKVRRARGVGVLFSGPPGTGKTLAAEVMAGELELDLYKVDLSGVVSKWIGETEKNLNRIFHEAETSNSILFFDEADALFGKRTKVSDAHDRYANIETSYLLQRMEGHDGVVVLATNLRENIDDAFTRRIRFVVDFPFPDHESRRQIWAAHFPSEAPVDAALDLDYLARELKIAGGSIRNIVLNAAFLAADNGRNIEMAHIVHATRREFEKIGKSWGELDDLRPSDGA
jgi:hypothetical protein